VDKNTQTLTNGGDHSSIKKNLNFAFSSMKCIVFRTKLAV